MTRRRKISWLFALGVVVAIFWMVVHDRFVAGPVYGGAPLNVWLRLLNETGPQNDERPREAIRQLGPAALPLIIEWLDWKDSLLRRALGAWVNGGPEGVAYQPLKPSDRRRIALEACDILGPTAKPAIPKLIVIATGANPELDAPFLIARIGGSEAAPALATISTTTNKFMRAGVQVSTELLKQSSPLLTSSHSPHEYQRQLQQYHVLVMMVVATGRSTNQPVSSR